MPVVVTIRDLTIFHISADCPANGNRSRLKNSGLRAYCAGVVTRTDLIRRCDIPAGCALESTAAGGGARTRFPIGDFSSCGMAGTTSSRGHASAAFARFPSSAVFGASLAVPSSLTTIHDQIGWRRKKDLNHNRKRRRRGIAMYMTQALRRWAKLRPDETAYVSANRQFTWAELAGRVARCAGALHALGLKHEDRVGDPFAQFGSLRRGLLRDLLGRRQCRADEYPMVGAGAYLFRSRTRRPAS